MADLEYDQAAALLTEVIVDERAAPAQVRAARALLAEVEIIRGYNSEARPERARRKPDPLPEPDV